eukprot:2326546-Prymnesium_polylepis.1
MCCCRSATAPGDHALRGADSKSCRGKLGSGRSRMWFTCITRSLRVRTATGRRPEAIAEEFD